MMVIIPVSFGGFAFFPSAAAGGPGEGFAALVGAVRLRWFAVASKSVGGDIF